MDCPIQGQSGIARPTGSVVPLHPQGRVDQGHNWTKGKVEAELPRRIMLILINVSSHWIASGSQSLQQETRQIGLDLCASGHVIELSNP
ncbi:hypothetical protein HAX54_015294 [Datura stramonium]|uniref:Uncharacterized protein n=1 Tax=Datura stramonium TaxID=4076 RepID=A0ABS8Y3Z4_DATST|nr:hypothetical protein [Datura stramonium]